jgi:hypothetical protein
MLSLVPKTSSTKDAGEPPFWGKPKLIQTIQTVVSIGREALHLLDAFPRGKQVLSREAKGRIKG